MAEVVGGPATWYHTFDRPDGSVTPGLFDLRKVVPKLPIPQSLTGMRCLDLASADGFFAVEMARRGGDVTSVDLDDPAGRDWQEDAPASGSTGARHRFELIKSELGLDIRRLDMNLYDVSPEALGGKFDFVFMGNVLLHVSDPGRVLTNIRNVTDGHFLCFETISATLTLTRPFTAAAVLGSRRESRWWTPNLRGHRRLLRAAGFEPIDGGFPVFQSFGPATNSRPEVPIWRAPEPLKYLTFWTLVRWLGVPSAWTLCQ